METTSEPRLRQPSLVGGQPVRGHVLVVDDDPGIRGFLEGLLQGEGFSVATATNGHEALDQIVQQRPDVVLLDLAMPVLTGLEVHARVRAQGLAIPIIFMSAGHDAAAEARRHGASGALAKPFDADEMLTLVARLIAATP